MGDARLALEVFKGTVSLEAAYFEAARLRTSTGTMHGSYFCVAEDGERFDVDIPMFVLDAFSDSGKRQMH